MSMTDFRAMCAELIEGMDNWADDWEEMVELKARARALLAQPVAQSLPANYIDPEHTGQDREVLDIFYTACQSEGGTTDEIHLRGIRAVLAARALLAQPVAEGPTDEELEDLADVMNVSGDPVPAMRRALELWGRPTPQPPVAGEVAAALIELRSTVIGLRQQRLFVAAQRVERAADLLQRQHPQPVAEGPTDEESDAFAIVQMRLDDLAGDQQLMIYRWPEAGEWDVHHTNPTSSVQLGEVNGKYSCGGTTFEEAVRKLAELLPTPETQ